MTCRTGRAQVTIEDGVQIVCHMHWQAKREEALTVIVVHGLEGSSKSLHVIGVANKHGRWAELCSVQYA